MCAFLRNSASSEAFCFGEDAMNRSTMLRASGISLAARLAKFFIGEKYSPTSSDWFSK